MGDRKYSADDIIKDINDGKKDEAIQHLNHDFIHMSPTDFNRVVKDMEAKTGADDDGWNNVYAERDADGNVTSVHIDDGILWDTKMFDKNDYKATLKNPFGAMKRALGGALDMGKEKE